VTRLATEWQQVPWGLFVTHKLFMVLLTIENCGSKLEKVYLQESLKLILSFLFSFWSSRSLKNFLQEFILSLFYVPWCNCEIWKDIPILLLSCQKVSFFSSIIWGAYSTAESLSHITGLVCLYQILLGSTICQFFCSKDKWNQNTSRGRNRFGSN